MRTKFVFKNIFAKWISVVLLTVFQFVARKIFVIYYNDNLMGLAGLLQSVISMLGLLELGVGSAIYFLLYEPMANSDYKKISMIMHLYRKIYLIIGIIIFLIGLILLPFLKNFISTDLNNSIIQKAYLILLLDTVLSYFLAYRRNIFNADQKEYICTNIDTICGILTTVFQILVTIVFHNYYLYLAIKVFWTLFGNIYIFLNSEKEYSYIKQKNTEKLPKEFMEKFYINVKSLCIMNIASYFVFGTDNLLLSKYAGLESVFIYSNYNTIIVTINKIFHNIFDSAKASIGNYMITEGKEKGYELFKDMFLINFFITCFTSVAMFVIFNDFISIWLGEKYVWSNFIIAVLVLNNYMRYIMQTNSVFRNAAGIYNPYPFYKYWSLVEGIVNILASIFFISVLNEKELGVFLGTTISTVVFTVPGIHALYKYYFSKENIIKFIKKYFRYLILTILYLVISFILCKSVRTNSKYINLVFDFIIAILVPNIFNILIFYNTSEFKHILMRIRQHFQKV